MNASANRTMNLSGAINSAPPIRPYATDRLQQQQYITDLLANPIHRLDAPYNCNWSPPGLSGEIVDELLLIRDILYCSQGLEAQLIETRHGQFQAKSSLRLLPSQKRLVRRLCAVGTLHQHLTSFIKEHRDYREVHALRKGGRATDPSDGADTAKNGLVLQSFLGSLDEELTALYQLLGCLHEKLEISLHPRCKVEDKMTLERLSVWLEAPRKRLLLLRRFCSAVRGATGGMIISQIYKFCRTGDEEEHRFTEGVLNEICRPIFDMIGKWIIEGQLNDPFGEFFIAQNVGDLELADIWQKKYVLKRKYIPIFIEHNLAQQIYAIGRNLNFIRVCCKDSGYEPIYADYFENIASFDIQHLSDFEAKIVRVLDITNQRLMQLLRVNFKVMEHAEAMRKYLLLAQGDFIQQFLCEIREEMGKNAAHIKMHDMQSKLESAVLQSNALYDDNDIRQRLRVKMLGSSAGDIGWNVFCLNYAVDLPINIIFDASAMKKYQKVFVFLMKIKLAKSVLNDAWKDQMRGNHSVSVFPDIHLVRHCIHLVRNSMDHLLQIFESYFMFDVLDAAWKTFLDSATKCADMDGLIASHAQYVSEITSKCFLGSDSRGMSMKKALEDILLQIHQFTAMSSELDQQLSHMQTLRGEQLAVLQQNYDAEHCDIDPRDSYLGALPSHIFSKSVSDDEYVTQYTALRKKQGEILFLFKSFHHKIAKLLELPKSQKAIPEHLERLLVQLDFNDFHLNWQTLQSHLLAVDLPINPYPMESFVKTRKSSQTQSPMFGGSKAPRNSRGQSKEIKDPKPSLSHKSSRPRGTEDRMDSKTNSYEYLTKISSTKSAASGSSLQTHQAQTHQADDMLSKLNAVLNPSSAKGNGNSASKPFVPSFVFPTNSANGDGAQEKKQSAPEFDDAMFGQYRTTAPFMTSNRDGLTPTPLKQRPVEQDIFAKYDFGQTPRGDKGMSHMGAIPHHLLPTPLQKKKTSQKMGDAAKRYAFEDASSTARGNGSGFADDEDVDSPFDDAGGGGGGGGALSTSGIRFSFDNQSRGGMANMPAMSPIPFARTLGKADESEAVDKNAWNRFIPTPLINQKTKSYRK